MKNLGILEREGTVFVLVDIQEKFIPAMSSIDETIANANILVKTSEILEMPLVVTEQYPQGLGHITEKVKLPEKKHLIEKMSFGCFGCDGFSEKIKELGARRIVLFGLESHICVLKTALEALNRDIEVHAVADSICSRKEKNTKIGLERMKQSGAFVVSTEMVLFQLMDRADTEEFKKIRSLIR
ncbi:MAG: hydrolase [Candidatus Micrarchaeota archaeon]|nr:hydrolase [Candidatus Micrarchaeota archaeon]MBU1681992.1 hydrolase [Candidatus Micrarchaeota archaeon]